MKVCNKCKLQKEETEFYKKGKYLRSICKLCSLNDFKIYGKEWKKNNKQYYKNIDKEKLKLYRKNYRINNPEKSSKYIKKYRENPLNRIIDSQRTRLRNLVKYGICKGHTLELIGCSLDDLRKHLQSQFKEGMTWDNYGKWHIDHIKPCSKFDFSIIQEQRKCFNYSNLQPLWAIDNLIKNNKY